MRKVESAHGVGHLLEPSVFVRDLLDGEDVDEPRELLDDLMDVGGFDDQQHPTRPRIAGGADDEARDVVIAAPNEADGSIERARPIVEVHHERVSLRVRGSGRHGRSAYAGTTLGVACVCASTSISPILRPCGTIGKTLASRSTRKSSTTTPG